MVERDWKDPVIDTPKQASDRTWRVIFIGGINLLLGIITYVVINYADVPVDVVPGLFMCVGGTFIVIGSYMSYRDRKLV
jgi:uncharacterized membrane protein HdeD (DUF308 family)